MPTKYRHLERLENTLAARFSSKGIAGIPRDWAVFPLSWLCYGTRDAAVRKTNPMWQADALAAVIDLFTSYYRPAIDEVSEKTGIKSGDKKVISVFVQPDLANPCTVLIVQAGIHNLVYLNQVKARQLWFDLPADLEADMEEEYNTILRNLR